ncbi:MAG: helix-turn-helix domain-containing protein [Candidatus Cryptobacteroides sp.]
MEIDVYDNYSGHYHFIDITKYEKAFITSQSLHVVMCHDGIGKYKFLMDEITITKGELLIIPPNVPFQPVTHDKRYEFDAIKIAESHFDIVDDITVRPQFEHLTSIVPVLKLDDMRMRMFHIILLYVNKLKEEYANTTEEQKRYIDQIINGYLKVVILEACRLLLFRDNRSLKNYTKQDKITKEFFKVLTKNYRSREKVSYYSHTIGVSPKKLTHTIFENTGKNPSEWIDEFSLNEAKRMLRTMDLTIQEIAYDLNFSTPSHFTLFFKKKTGMTPSEYKSSY